MGEIPTKSFKFYNTERERFVKKLVLRVLVFGLVSPSFYAVTIMRPENQMPQKIRPYELIWLESDQDPNHSLIATEICGLNFLKIRVDQILAEVWSRENELKCKVRTGPVNEQV